MCIYTWKSPSLCIYMYTSMPPCRKVYLEPLGPLPIHIPKNVSICTWKIKKEPVVIHILTYAHPCLLAKRLHLESRGRLPIYEYISIHTYVIVCMHTRKSPPLNSYIYISMPPFRKVCFNLIRPFSYTYSKLCLCIYIYTYYVYT